MELVAPPDLVGQVYRTGIGPAEVASLAPLVHVAAEQGDAVRSTSWRRRAASWPWRSRRSWSN